MLTGSCHCKAVRFEVDSMPKYLNSCHCSICWRYGVLWAYYPTSQVKLIVDDDVDEFYVWGEKKVEFHRCKKCGCVTHWALAGRTEPRMAINARLIDETDLKDVPVKQSYD